MKDGIIEIDNRIFAQKACIFIIKRVKKIQYSMFVKKDSDEMNQFRNMYSKNLKQLSCKYDEILRALNLKL